VAFDSSKIRGIKDRSAKNLGGGVNVVVFPERILVEEEERAR
jgi:hypothetical protein